MPNPMQHDPRVLPPRPRKPEHPWPPLDHECECPECRPDMYPRLEDPPDGISWIKMTEPKPFNWAALKATLTLLAIAAGIVLCVAFPDSIGIVTLGMAITFMSGVLLYLIWQGLYDFFGGDRK